VATATARPAPAASRAASRPLAALGHWNSAVTSYYVLLGATLLLLALGLVMVLSSSSVESLQKGDSPYAVFLDQSKYALVGLVLLVVLARVPVRVLRRFAWPALIAAVAFQLLVFTPLGRSVGGNRNWVHLPGFSAQPSEAVKLALALWMGAVLARKLRLLDDWKHVLIPAGPVAAAAIGVVLLGHDLGTALVMILLVVGALWVASVPKRFLALAGLGGAAVAAALTMASDNRKNRILSWLSPTCDVQDECYQTLHGSWGLATGGIGGLGLGASREKWSYLPAAHNDFIFAIIGEELGLVGTLLVLVLFGLLAFAMIRVIRRHDDAFAQITTGAICFWIIGQAIVNIAVVVGMLPVIGVPLPLVSAGGSALIMTMGAIGVVLAFARTEPGAAEALAARPSVVRRSLAVLGRARG
jgi:cell division protein FtsW